MISRGAIASVLGMAGVAGALLGAFAAETHGPATGDVPFAPFTRVTTEPAPLPTDRPTSGSAAEAGSAPDSFAPFTIGSFGSERRIVVVTTSDPVPPVDPGPIIDPPAISDPPTGNHGGPTPWNGPPSSPEPTKPPIQD